MPDIMEMLATSPNETNQLVQMALIQQGVDPFASINLDSLDEDSKLEIAAQQLMTMLATNREAVRKNFPEIFAKYNEAEVYENSLKRTTTLGAMPDRIIEAREASLARPNTGVTSGGGVAGISPDDPIYALLRTDPKAVVIEANEQLTRLAKEGRVVFDSQGNAIPIDGDKEANYWVGARNAGFVNMGLLDEVGGMTAAQAAALGLDQQRFGLEQARFGLEKEKFGWDKEQDLWTRDFMTAQEKRRIIEQRANLGLTAASTIGNIMNQSMANTINASRSAIPAGMKYTPWGNPNTIGKYMQSIGLPFEATPAVGISINPGAVNSVVQDLINKAMSEV